MVSQSRTTPARKKFFEQNRKPSRDASGTGWIFAKATPRRIATVKAPIAGPNTVDIAMDKTTATAAISRPGKIGFSVCIRALYCKRESDVPYTKDWQATKAPTAEFFALAVLVVTLAGVLASGSHSDP